jgi:hypothetical protein
MQRVVIVQLRRPKSKAEDPEEMRSDPFWEFGSFGVTGCHGRNLMHPKNASALVGVRLAFAQGGKLGTRLVFLTPPVSVVKHENLIEAVWNPHSKPFRYDRAPILVSNNAPSNFPKLAGRCKSRLPRTIEAIFSSRFRSRTSHLESELADELIRGYESFRRKASRFDISKCYSNALPWEPPQIDQHRQETYEQKLNEARGVKRLKGRGGISMDSCSRKKKKSRSCGSC